MTPWQVSSASSVTFSAAPDGKSPFSIRQNSATIKHCLGRSVKVLRHSEMLRDRGELMELFGRKPPIGDRAVQQLCDQRLAPALVELALHVFGKSKLFGERGKTLALIVAEPRVGQRLSKRDRVPRVNDLPLRRLHLGIGEGERFAKRFEVGDLPVGKVSFARKAFST